MSADNWTVCPRCFAAAEDKVAKLKEKAAKAYGKVSAEDYQALLRKSEEKPERADHLAEYKQTGVQDDGTFLVSYHCICRNCGFEFNFNHQEPAFKRK